MSALRLTVPIGPFSSTGCRAAAAIARSVGGRWAFVRLLSCLAAMAASLTVMASPAQAEPWTIVASRPIHTGTSHELQSEITGDVRQINVWLPAGYDRSQDTYSIIYLLDGGLDQDFHHIAGLAQLGSLSWTFGPLIVVGVQTRQRQAELTPPADDARYVSAFPQQGGAHRFRLFLEREVIPFVEARYRAGPRRALMGESLAGLFVVDTLLKRSELFHDYIAISPSLWWDNRRPMRDAARQLKNMAAGRRLYLAIANEGGTMQEGVDLLRSALARPASPPVSIRYSDRSAHASHSTVYHGAAEEALRWLYPMPPYDAAPTPWYMIDGASPPPSQSKPH